MSPKRRIVLAFAAAGFVWGLGLVELNREAIRLFEAEMRATEQAKLMSPRAPQLQASALGVLIAGWSVFVLALAFPQPVTAGKL